MSSVAKRYSKSVKLPPLVVVIRKGRRIVRRVKIPDPRAMYMEEFNKQGQRFGLIAQAG